MQKVMELSCTDVEYMAPTEAIKEAIWLKGFTDELGYDSEDITMLCDNQSTLYLRKNSMFHERSKQIYIKLHFMRDIFGRNKVQFNKIGFQR